MKDIFVIINHNANAYRKTSKKIKSQILTELSQILNRNRQYLGTLLRGSAKVILKKTIYRYSLMQPLMKSQR